MSRKIKKEQIHYIYKIHFLCGFPTGRYYLGKRTYNGVDISNDKYNGSGNFCKEYFEKYGAFNGKTYLKEILEINPSYEINKEREVIIVGDLWKTDPLCMNQRGGGDGGLIPGHTVSEEGKKHLSELNSEEVYQYDLNGNLIKKYDSIIEASKETGACRTKISSCCNGDRLTAGGYIWRKQNVEISEEDLNQIKDNTKFKSKDKRAVYRIDKITNEKVKYESVRDAARKNNIHNSSIHEVCSGKRHTAGGYEWKFVED